MESASRTVKRSIGNKSYKCRDLSVRGNPEASLHGHKNSSMYQYNCCRYFIGIMAERVGFEPTAAIGYTQVTHFTLRPIRQKRPKRQTEVHRRYTEHCRANVGRAGP